MKRRQKDCRCGQRVSIVDSQKITGDVQRQTHKKFNNRVQWRRASAFSRSSAF